jgi:hypothetical protein
MHYVLFSHVKNLKGKIIFLKFVHLIYEKYKSTQMHIF